MLTIKIAAVIFISGMACMLGLLVLAGMIKGL